jgi:histidyl-tRNA synthetase
MAMREKAFGMVAGVFKWHGVVALDMPAFDLWETLMGKYGEDTQAHLAPCRPGSQVCPTLFMCYLISQRWV